MMQEQEIWKDIKGYEGLYQVSNIGRVKSLSHMKRTWKGGKYMTKEKILVPQNSRGYKRVNLCSITGLRLHSVHRLVAIAFIPNADNKPFINHKNGKRGDNRLQNLEWVTNSENVRHAINELHTGSFGEACPLSILTEQHVKEIRGMYDTKQYTLSQIAQLFNINHSTVWQIGKRITWKHLNV